MRYASLSKFFSLMWFTAIPNAVRYQKRSHMRAPRSAINSVLNSIIQSHSICWGARPPAPHTSIQCNMKQLAADRAPPAPGPGRAPPIRAPARAQIIARLIAALPQRLYRAALPCHAPEYGIQNYDMLMQATGTAAAEAATVLLEVSTPLRVTLSLPPSPSCPSYDTR